MTSPVDADNRELNDDDINPHDEEVIDMTIDEHNNGTNPIITNEDDVHVLSTVPTFLHTGKLNVTREVIRFQL